MLTFEQGIAIAVVAGAFGGAGAYFMNVAIRTFDLYLLRKREQRAFERMMADPVKRAEYQRMQDAVAQGMEDLAKNLGVKVKRLDQ